MPDLARGTRLKITTLLAGSIFLSGAAFAAMTPYRAIVGVETLGLSNAMFGLVMGLNGIAGALIAVIFGWLSDRVEDRRVLLLLAAILGAVGLGLVWWLRSPLAFVAAFCLLVPFGNATFSQSFAYARAILDRDRPGKAQLTLSYLRTTFTLAWIVMPPVAGWIAAGTTAYGAFGLGAAAQIGCVLFVALLWSRADAKIGFSKKGQDGTAAVRQTARIDVSYRWGIVGVTLGLIALQLNMVVLPLVILQDLGGSLADVGINSAIAAAIEVPAMIAWGYVALRLCKEVALAIACAIFAVYFGLVAVATSVEQVMLLQGIAAVAIAAILSINISYLQDAIKGRVGLSTSLVDISRVAAVLIASGIFALNVGEHFAPLFVIAAASSAVAASLLLFAGRLSKMNGETGL